MSAPIRTAFAEFELRGTTATAVKEYFAGSKVTVNVVNEDKDTVLVDLSYGPVKGANRLDIERRLKSFARKQEEEVTFNLVTSSTERAEAEEPKAKKGKGKKAAKAVEPEPEGMKPLWKMTRGELLDLATAQSIPVDPELDTVKTLRRKIKEALD